MMLNKEEEMAEIAAKKANTVEIYLSSRGWGDYSSVVIAADLRKSDAKLVTECREALNSEDDVDDLKQSDTEIQAKINAARAKHAAPKEKYTEPDHGDGYCYSCDTYCYGDCGNYQPKQTAAIIMRNYRNYQGF